MIFASLFNYKPKLFIINKSTKEITAVFTSDDEAGNII